MQSSGGQLCDSCGLHVDLSKGSDCPRCGYPVLPQKEVRSLKNALKHLERVAKYGGGQMTVGALIQRYQRRLAYLRQEYARQNQPVQAEQDPVLLPKRMDQPDQLQHKQAEQQEKAVNKVPEELAPVSVGPVFSIKTFFTDQAINIFALLGAFLILAGSLSFVTTTYAYLTSFIVIFLVHLFFAISGIATGRFESFRTISNIYTALSALLIPHVGFATHELITYQFNQQSLHLSTPTLITIIAVYATIAYIALAIYQRFAPFAYLGAVTLLVTVLALGEALNVTLEWRPAMVLLLALLLLVVQKERFPATIAIIRTPMRFLMYTSLVIGGCGLVLIWGYSLVVDLFIRPRSELRQAVVCTALLLLLWTALRSWLAAAKEHVSGWSELLPYLFIVCILAGSYALNFELQSYGLVLVATAWLFHLLMRYAGNRLRSLGKIERHMLVLSLITLVILPLIIEPTILLHMLASPIYWLFPLDSVMAFQSTMQRGVVLLTLLLAVSLTVSIAIQQAGGQKEPASKRQKAWCWLLLLASPILFRATAIIMQIVQVEPTWGYLGLTLGLVMVAAVVQARVSAIWAYPLDVLAIGAGLLTMWICSIQLPEEYIAVILRLMALLYGFALYQRRAWLLLIPGLLGLRIVEDFHKEPFLFLLVALLTPLLAVLVERLIVRKREEFKWKGIWTLPLLGIGILYALMVALSERHSSSSLLQQQFAGTLLAFPVVLEIGVLALVWYAAAALAKNKWWLLGATGFGLIALFMPGHTIWSLLWIAFTLVMIGFGMERLVGKSWAWSVYSVSIATMCFVGSGTMGQGTEPEIAAWALLIFAVILYGIGILQDGRIQIWLAVFFASWSTLNASLLGDLYRAPSIALIWVALGVGIGCLRFVVPTLKENRDRHLDYTIPIYIAAGIAMIMTGVLGWLNGIHNPFYAAIPLALLLFAVVTYGVLLFEQRPQWLWLVAALAIWGTFLAMRTTIHYMTGIAVGAAVLGLIAGRLTTRVAFMSERPTRVGQMSWSWSWYVTALSAASIIVYWQVTGIVVGGRFIVFSLLTLTALAFAIMLVERLPLVIVIGAGLAGSAILAMQLGLWQYILIGSLLWVLVFGSKQLWQLFPLPASQQRYIKVHHRLGLLGQSIMVLLSLSITSTQPESAMIEHAGSVALLVLGALIFWYGRLQEEVSTQRRCMYLSGLLLSLVVTWELHAFGVRQLDLLTLVPASYLVVIAPLLSHDRRLPDHHNLGQLCSIAGSILLLLPTLWLSFNDTELTPTLLLAGEALVLCIFGIVVRSRTFVLSGVSLVIVSAMHAPFLPSLSIHPSIALSIIGGTLLALATGLSLARHRLKEAWLHWE